MTYQEECRDPNKIMAFMREYRKLCIKYSLFISGEEDIFFREIDGSNNELWELYAFGDLEEDLRRCIVISKANEYWRKHGHKPYERDTEVFNCRLALEKEDPYYYTRWREDG